MEWSCCVCWILQTPWTVLIELWQNWGIVTFSSKIALPLICWTILTSNMTVFDCHWLERTQFACKLEGQLCLAGWATVGHQIKRRYNIGFESRLRSWVDDGVSLKLLTFPEQCAKSYRVQNLPQYDHENMSNTTNKGVHTIMWQENVNFPHFRRKKMYFLHWLFHSKVQISNVDLSFLAKIFMLSLSGSTETVVFLQASCWDCFCLL